LKYPIASSQLEIRKVPAPLRHGRGLSSSDICSIKRSHTSNFNGLAEWRAEKNGLYFASVNIAWPIELIGWNMVKL
jgi:hypothetical protein